MRVYQTCEKDWIAIPTKKEMELEGVSKLIPEKFDKGSYEQALRSEYYYHAELAEKSLLHRCVALTLRAWARESGIAL